MRFTFSKFHNVTKIFDKQILLVNSSRITADTSVQMLSPFSTTSGHQCKIIKLYYCIDYNLVQASSHSVPAPHSTDIADGKDRAVNMQRPLSNDKLLPSR